MLQTVFDSATCGLDFSLFRLPDGTDRIALQALPMEHYVGINPRLKVVRAAPAPHLSPPTTR
jgi:hypothetical protein